MSFSERSIVPKSPRPSSLSRQFVFVCVVLICAALGGVAIAQSDSWRRTPLGWERTESWKQLTEPPIGRLRQLSLDTLVQRTWPATIALAELFLILALLQPTVATVERTATDRRRD